MTPNKISAINARYSSYNQHEASIADQIRICREYAESKGKTVSEEHIYIDEARSGQVSANRDQFRLMLECALRREHPFQRILVEHTSRIARNPREALDVFSLLTFYGVHVSYVSQGIDTASGTAEESITIHGLIDSLYLRTLAFETRRGMIGQVMKGFSGGGRHYGYYSEQVLDGKVDIYGNPTVEGCILRINPVEAETVRRIFKMFGEQGLSSRQIANILNAEIKKTGHPKPPQGQYWNFARILGSQRQFSGILNNRLYEGVYVWNRTSVRINPETDGRVTVSKEPSQWIVIPKPDLAIVPQSLWEKVKIRQKEISKNSGGRYTRGKASYSKNLLTGLPKCDYCAAG